MAKSSDIPFAHDSSSLFICWISMLMVFISTLVLAFAVITYDSVSSWHKNISGSMTVQIPTHDSQGKDRGDAVQMDIETALSLLRTTDGVNEAHVLDEHQMDLLMSPWMGEKTSTAGLPLPKLIDVSVDVDNLPDIDQIRADFDEQVPLAVLDSHRLALTDLIALAQNIIKLTGGVLVLMLASMAFSIMFTTKSGLKVHRNVIALIHMMGASDFYITRQFAGRSATLSFIGGLFGFLFALPVMFSVSYYLGNVSGGFIIKGALSNAEWGLLAVIPLFAAVLSYITAATTVFMELKRSL